LPPAGPQVVPQAFKTPHAAEGLLIATKPAAGVGSQRSTWSWLSWWRLNAPLVILNFGSFATLVGFTRSDVLELRCLAITGNMTFVIYSLLQPPPIRWPAICWSVLFGGVNGFSIAKFVHEREGKVILSKYEEEIFLEHFKPHGVTPKQFETLMSTGKSRIVKRGDVLSRQGEPMTSAKLVIRGDTRANIKGRRLTAMGSMRGNRHSLQGGDSGAWIGEMAFLQSLWDRDNRSSSLRQKLSTKNMISSSDEEVSLRPDPTEQYSAISTIVAVEDCELIEWAFEDMRKVMKSSRYIQEALTRAMTAAVVGKVVNFLMSRRTGAPKWSTLLDHWNHTGPKHGDEEDVAGAEETEEEEEGLSQSAKEASPSKFSLNCLRYQQ